MSGIIALIWVSMCLGAVLTIIAGTVVIGRRQS